MGVLSRGSRVSPKFSAPTAKLCIRHPKASEAQEVIEVLYHRAKFGEAGISRAARAAKTLSLFVCLSVTHLNVRVCAPDFAMKALEYRNDLDAVG